MKIIDRYVAEVGKRLPLIRGRGDIERELRSTLEDMLEDRAQKTGHPADESMAVELLKEYGAPDKVAATYNAYPYLIGPRMFPFFIMVLKLVIFGVAIGLTVVTVLQIITHNPSTSTEVLHIIGGGIFGIISTVMTAFGYIVLAFAIIERYAPFPDFKLDEEQEWDPVSLMKEPEPDEVKPWESILGIVFTSIAIIIFNFYPQLIGIYTFSGDRWNVTPVLSDAFFRWMPLINIAWIAGMVLDGWMLRSGRWTFSSRLFALAIKILSIIIGILLFTGPSIIAFTPESLQATKLFDIETAQTLGTLAQQGTHYLIGLILVLQGVDMVKTIHQLVRQKLSADVK